MCKVHLWVSSVEWYLDSQHRQGSSGVGNTDAENKGKEIVLDESDNLWVDLRHVHIADCITQVIGSFNKFLNENKAATNMTKSK
jgi:hypothetical protein